MNTRVVLNESDLRRAFFENMTEDAFRELGATQMAYIRPVQIDRRDGYAIYNGSGHLLAVQDTPEMAQALIHANDMAAITLH